MNKLKDCNSKSYNYIIMTRDNYYIHRNYEIMVQELIDNDLLHMKIYLVIDIMHFIADTITINELHSL